MEKIFVETLCSLHPLTLNNAKYAFIVLFKTLSYR